MQSPELSIIIVSYKTRDLLADCLRSLRRVAGEARFETIVVDNASMDGSVEMVESEFAEVRLLPQRRNLGFAAAMNEGLAACQAPLFLALNPDTIMPQGSIDRLVRFLEKTPQAAVAGAVMVGPDGSPQGSVFRFPSLFREFWNFLPELKAALRPRATWYGISSDLTLRHPFKTESVSGAGLLARTDAVRAIGGFDEGFFLYHEEQDLCARLRKAGWEVWSVPHAHVIHYDAMASGFRTNRLPRMPLLEWRIGGMDRLWAKHKSPFEHRLWQLQGKVLLCLRILCLSPGALFSRKIRERIAELTKIVRMLGADKKARQPEREAELSR